MRVQKTFLGYCFVGMMVIVCLGTASPGVAHGQDTADRSLAAKKSGGPIVITGDNLEIDSKRKIATYTGNVKVVQGTTSMFSDLLVIYLDQSGKKLERAVATGNVRLVDDTITATGEEGIFYNEEQKLELNRQAKVWQGNNTITAHHIIAFLGDEIIEGYKDDSSNERAIMTVYSKGQMLSPLGQNSAEPDKNPAENQATEEEGSSPIVIVADMLKLDNPAGLATYTGDVVATQDATELNSDEMYVYIVQSEDAGNEIERIEVQGHVRIIRENTVVTGEKGVYINKDQFAVVEGTTKTKARAEDKVQNMILEAPIIEAFLATNTIKAKGQETRVRTTFGTEESDSLFAPAEPTPTPKEHKGTDKDLPSVTVYPKKKP